jgi:hypothetical protein
LESAAQPFHHFPLPLFLFADGCGHRPAGAGAAALVGRPLDGRSDPCAAERPGAHADDDFGGYGNWHGAGRLGANETEIRVSGHTVRFFTGANSPAELTYTPPETLEGTVTVSNRGRQPPYGAVTQRRR